MIFTHSFNNSFIYLFIYLVAQMVKNLPAMQVTQVQYLGWEHPLEKGMAPTPVFLAEKSRGQRSLAGHSPWDWKEWDMAEQRFQFHLFTWAKGPVWIH